MATLFNTRIADTYQGLLKTIDNGILGAGFTEISDGSGNGTSVSLNTSGDLQATGIISFGSLKDIGENITIAKFVDAADGLINNDNDTTIPTSAAIIDYVATQITLEDLDFTGDGGTTGSVDLDSQVFSILGTTNQITTSGSGQTLTIGLPSSVTISGVFTATTFLGDLNGTINTATTATTQSAGDNSTKVATTAYVDSVVTAQDLDFAGTTGSGSVDLDSQTFTIQGTTNEITTAATGQILTVGLPSSITTDLVGNVTGNLTGDVTGDLTGNTNGVHTGSVVGNVTGNLTGDVTGDLTGNTTGLHTGNVVGNVTGDLVGAVTGNVTGNLTGDVTGNLTGDVTGDVTGSVTGNVTGNLTGDVTGNVTGDLTGNADTATAWATGRTISLTGEATGTSASLDGTASVSAAVTLTNSSVIDKVLTGLQSPAGATILATDSMLVAFGKLQSQINGIAEGLQFQGSWNASTNTPTLTSSTGTQGHYYIVSVAGSTNLDGVTDWEVGDWAIFSTTGVWQRLDQTGVQGTGTTGNLTKWATGSTISDSIVSELGTALTVTGSLNTTLATTVDGNLTVGTDSLIVNSVSDAVSMAGILTVASPVINTGISGSAILDDDTFATASATTVATSESIKAYVDAQDQGSGTVGTIAKFATSTTFNNSVITQSSTDLFLGGETYIPSNELIVGANNQNASTEYLEIDGGTGSFFGGGGAVLSHNQTLSLGTIDAESVSLWTTNQQRFVISSGGTATFYGSLIGTSATFSGNVGIGGTPPSLSGYTSLSINNATNGAILDLEQGDAMKARLIATSSSFAVETASGIPINFQPSGSTALTISSGGNADFSQYIRAKGSTTAPTSGVGIELAYNTAAHLQRGQIGAYDRTNSAYKGLYFYANDYVFDIGGTPKLTISSGGEVEINNLIKFADTTAGSAGTPQFKTLLSYQFSNVNALSTIKGGNEASATYGTYLKFSVNSKDAVNTPIDILTLKSAFVGGTTAQFDALIKANNGISFPNQSAGSGTVASSTLDAYEEGTWSALLTASTTAFNNQSARSATYVRVGNLVTIQMEALIAGAASGGAGEVRITGLPFTNISSQAALGAWNPGRVTLTNTLGSVALIPAGANYINFRMYVNSANSVLLDAVAINGQSTPYISATITYQIS